MGPLITTWLMVLGSAHAATELRLIQATGPVTSGEETLLEIAAVDGQGKAITSEPRIEADRGEVLGPPVATRSGRWQVAFRMPLEGSSWISATLDGQTERIEVVPQMRAITALKVPAAVNGRVGQVVEFQIENDGPDALLESSIEVIAPEGRVVSITAADGGLAVRWQPGSALFPRSVPLFIRDGRTPRRVPARTVIRLRARPSIPVRTEPGAQVQLVVSGRTIGTTIAGPDGVASFVANVRPGESVAEVRVTDALGNTQTSQIALGGDPRPGIVLASSGPVLVGRASPEVWIQVVEADGAQWRRGWPTCRSADGQRLDLQAQEPGLWKVQLPGALTQSAYDLRVACTVRGLTEATLRLPVERMHPTRLVLRAHPLDLTADLPQAELQVILENAIGDRLSVGGISLAAELGVVTMLEESTTTLLRAQYDGARAASKGGDLIRATWTHVTGTGGVWDLGLRGGREPRSNQLVVDVRAVNHAGQPVEGHPVRVRAGTAEKDVHTGSQGWATVVLPWAGNAKIMAVTVDGGGLVRRHLVMFDDPILGTVGSADLLTELALRIRPGRVHSIFITPEPRVLDNTGEVGRIVVRLEDRLGNPVKNQQVRIDAASGVMGPVRAREDGTYDAAFAPPVGMPSGSVRITAMTDDGNFSASTDVGVAPRAVRAAVGAQAGFLLGSDELSSLFLGVEVDVQFRQTPLYIRGRLGVFGEEVALADGATGESVSLAMRAFPVTVGLALRTVRERIPIWVGSSLVLTPYQTAARFGNEAVVSGLSISSLGAGLYTGAGWRLNSGEVQIQLEYVFIPVGSRGVGWQGSIGGVVGTLGYKVLY